MNDEDLRAALARAPEGSEIRVDSGEFRGPWVVERRLRLVGTGGATVLWAPRGPALLVRAAGVHLQALVLEVTQEDDGVALAVAADVPAPMLSGVRVLGRVEGMGPERQWRLPKSVDFGLLRPGSPVRRAVGLQLPGDIVTRSEIDGLDVHTEPAAFGGVVLQMQLDAARLRPGTIVDGRLEIEAGGLLMWMRLTAQVAEALPPPRHAGAGAGGSPITQDFEAAWQRHAAAAPAAPPAPPPAPPPPRPPAPVRAPTPAPARGNTPAPAQPAPLPLLDQARTAMEAGDVEQAAALLDQALRRAPRHAPAHAMRAAVGERQGAYADAAAAWRQVIALDPAHAGAHRRLALCLSQLGHFDDAVQLLEGVRREAGNDADADFLKLLAQAYYNARRPADALRTLHAAEVALGRSDPRMNLLRASWARAESAR